MTVTLLLAGTYVKFTEDRGYLAAKRFFYTALEKLSLFDNFHFYDFKQTLYYSIRT